MHATSLSPELDVARSLDARLVAARKAQRGAEYCLAILLAELADTSGHRLLGYASIEQYAMARVHATIVIPPVAAPGAEQMNAAHAALAACSARHSQKSS